MAVGIPWVHRTLGGWLGCQRSASYPWPLSGHLCHLGRFQPCVTCDIVQGFSGFGGHMTPALPHSRVFNENAEFLDTRPEILSQGVQARILVARPASRNSNTRAGSVLYRPCDLSGLSSLSIGCLTCKMGSGIPLLAGLQVFHVLDTK